MPLYAPFATAASLATHAALTPATSAHALAKGAAYTQTYSTATRTHSNLTASSVVTTAAGLASYGYTEAQANALVAAVNAVIVDVTNVKGVLNSVVDDSQAAGLSS